LAGGIAADVLHQDLLDALHDAAVDLAVQQHGIERREGPCEKSHSLPVC
jgi:hypothetical protein